MSMVTDMMEKFDVITPDGKTCRVFDAVILHNEGLRIQYSVLYTFDDCLNNYDIVKRQSDGKAVRVIDKKECWLKNGHIMKIFDAIDYTLWSD